MQLKINCFFEIWMHAKLKEWNFRKVKKPLNCTKMKSKWNFTSFEMQMKWCNIWKCKWKFAKNLKWNFIWNSLKTAQKEKSWLLWKRFASAKRSQGHGGWVSHKELTSFNFLSIFCKYYLSYMPNNGKMISLKFQFQICAGLVMTKYFLCILSLPY